MSKIVEAVCLADLNRPAFEQDRLVVDVVCAGDSITGWNNFGPAKFWPFPTYPRFLQESIHTGYFTRNASSWQGGRGGPPNLSK
jgi:hypothetical protein